MTSDSIYRPSPSKKNKIPQGLFLEELTSLIVNLKQKNILLLGDFNVHWDNPSDAVVKKFIKLLDSNDLIQHISVPMHRSGHTLDWVITRSNSHLVSDVMVTRCVSLTCFSFAKTPLQGHTLSEHQEDRQIVSDLLQNNTTGRQTPYVKRMIRP